MSSPKEHELDASDDLIGYEGNTSKAYAPFSQKNRSI